jgi:hypothetical protein
MLTDRFNFISQLEALQPSAYKNVHEYGKRYCMGVSAFGIALIWNARNPFVFFVYVFWVPNVT